MLLRHVLAREDVARFRDELRWFAKSLGDARDLDVYAESFKTYAQTLPPAQRAAFRGYELYLRRERAKARRRAAAAFASPRATALIAGLERLARAGPSAAALRRSRSFRIRDAARRSIRGSVARVRRTGRALDARSRPTALHKLRIKSKQLRYELEFFAEAFPQLAATASACKAMQDLLGEHQDAYTANSRLRRYAALLRKQGGPGELPPALEKLRKRQLEHARSLRQSFEDRWPAFATAIEAARRAVA
jgi:CHAD domain-containing protein